MTDVSAAAQLAAAAGGDPGTCIGRLLRVERHKYLTFLWCWSPPHLVQCVASRAIAADVRAGTFIRVTGQWRPYGGRRPQCYHRELSVDTIAILSAPARQASRQGIADLERSAALYGRGLAVARGQAHLDDAGFVRLTAPLIVGADAEIGTTTPFRVIRESRHAFLTVNNLVSAHEAIAAGLDPMPRSVS